MLMIVVACRLYLLVSSSELNRMNASPSFLPNFCERCAPLLIARLTFFGLLIICLGPTLELTQVGTAQTVRDEASLIDDSRAPFVYEAKAEIPSPPEELVGFVSSTYRNSTDEFQQHSLLEKIKPVIDRRIAEARATKLFVVKLVYTLPKYDFDRQGFLTPVNETSYIYFNNSAYIVKFTNWDEVDFIPFEESKARFLEPTLHGNRQATLRVYGTLKECREDNVNGSDKKIIYLEVAKAVLAVGAESRFAGQKVISSDPDAVGTPVPSTGAKRTSPSDISSHPSEIQNIEDDPRFKPLDDRLNQVYSSLRSKLSPPRREQLKQFERDFISQRDHLKNNPDGFFALTEQQIAALERMLNAAP
jgi:hypothetical protein